MAPSTPPPANASIAEKIKTFYKDYPDFSKFVTEPPNEATDTEAETLSHETEKLKLKNETKEEKIEGLRRDFKYIGGPEVLNRKHPKDINKEFKQKHKQNASPPS